MNERIKNLLREAGGVLKDEDGTELPTYLLVGNAPEQFAELIVRECADVAFLEANSRKTQRAVLQHFGVEE